MVEYFLLLILHHSSYSESPLSLIYDIQLTLFGYLLLEVQWTQQNAVKLSRIRVSLDVHLSEKCSEEPQLLY